MFDRALGLLGLALTLITAAAPSVRPDLPDWITPSGLGLGILLTGVSLGLLLAGGLRKPRAVAHVARLRLRIYGDHRTPERIADENIFRWYYLQNAINGITPEGVTTLAHFTTLFVSFEPDVKITTLRVLSPDIALPHYDVREFNQRYAIIQFAENLPVGELEVRIGP